MSRIAGIAGPHAESILNRMLEAAVHGSPRRAGARQQVSPGAGLWFGAIDSRGRSCIAEHEGLTVVLDGFLYNRSELPDGASDAERFARLCRIGGVEAALGKVNGDFGIAVSDRATGALWLARDRMAVKPLYYASTPEHFAFASRPRPLLTVPGVSAAINRRFAAVFAASHYRYFDNHPEESPYEGVAQLPAAHWLKWHDGAISIGRYWSVLDQPDLAGSESDLAAQYRELLLDAVRIRVAAAGRPIFTLSGGMDSSSVLACAVRALGARQEAVSTVYTDRTYDESDEIRSMLESTVSSWHRVPVDDPDVFGLVDRMVEAHDEPIATATWLSHYVLCDQVAAGGFDAVFGGLGGDELNAGEYEHFFFHFADLRRAGNHAQLDREIVEWVRYHDHPIHRKSRAVADEVMDRVVDLSQPGVCRRDDRRLRRYYATLDPAYYDLEQFEPRMEAPFASYLKTRTFQDLTHETAPCCLRAEDRQTAAFGLDNHVPFFDHRLIEFMFRVPGSLKIRDGVTKILLREAMRGILPEETRTRVKKTGWNAPAHVWFSGSGRERLMDLIASQAFRERGIYNVAEVRRLADEHEAIVSTGAARDNHMMFFWQLVNLEAWLNAPAPRQDGA